MTQINLANLTTQIQPARTGKAIGNDTSLSADRLRLDEQKNLPVQSDDQQSNSHKSFEGKNLRDNSKFTPKVDQQGGGQVADKLAEKDSTDSKNKPARINFEEIVANILVESGLSTEQPVVTPAADLEILPTITQPETMQIGAVLGKNELGTAITDSQAGPIGSNVSAGVTLAEAIELPAQTKGNLPVGQAVTNNIDEAVQVVPVDGVAENLQATQITGQAGIAAEVVNPELQQANPDALAASQTEVGQIKLEGFTAQPTETELPLGTNEFEIAGLANDSLEAGPDAAKVSQQAVKSQVNSQTSELNEAAVPVVEKSNQVQTQTVSVASESAEQLSSVQAQPSDIETKIAQARQARASRIASYREVQESVSTESKPVASLPVSDAANKVEAKAGQVLKTGDAPVSEIAMAETNTQVSVADSNLNAAAELLQPVESAGVAAVSGASSVIDASLARPASTEMIEQITTHIQANRNNIGEQMTIRLDPPELGQIKIEIRSNDSEGLRGIVEVEHGRTLTELNREAPALMQRLNDAGIQVKNMEFRMSDQSDQRGSSTNDNAAEMFNNFGANSQGRGGQAHGDAQGEGGSFSDRSQYSQDLNDLSAEVDGTYNHSGHYVSDSSLNVMI